MSGVELAGVSGWSRGKKKLRCQQELTGWDDSQ
jgi:hypothetical protein